jgi:hypothetical protein
MRFSVLALDYDGTIAQNGALDLMYVGRSQRLAPEASSWFL